MQFTRRAWFLISLIYMIGSSPTRQLFKSTYLFNKLCLAEQRLSFTFFGFNFNFQSIWFSFSFLSALHLSWKGFNRTWLYFFRSLSWFSEFYTLLHKKPENVLWNTLGDMQVELSFLFLTDHCNVNREILSKRPLWIK